MKFLFHEFMSLTKAKQRIVELINEEYPVNSEMNNPIKKRLNSFLSTLNKTINVFIEHPYVDKVYRDSYYNYFSTKYKEYQRDAIRISFFSNNVTEKNFSTNSN